VVVQLRRPVLRHISVVRQECAHQGMSAGQIHAGMRMAVIPMPLILPVHQSKHAGQVNVWTVNQSAVARIAGRMVAGVLAVVVRGLAMHPGNVSSMGHGQIGHSARPLVVVHNQDLAIIHLQL